MKKFFLNKKWKIFWSMTVIMFAIYVSILCKYHNYDWIDSWIQVGGVAITLFVTIIIMLQNNENSNKSTKRQIKALKNATQTEIAAIHNSASRQMEHITTITAQQIIAMREETVKQMEHLTVITNKQIEVNREEYEKQNKLIIDVNYNQITNIQNETIRQINALQDLFSKQMEHVAKLTNDQIEVQRKESDRQVNTFKKETKKQIDSFVDQTEEITDRLEMVTEQLITLSKLSGQLVEAEKELKKIEEEKLALREKDLIKQNFESQAEIERFKPILAFRLEDITEYILFQYTYIYIHNAGADTKGIRFSIHYRNHFGKTKSYNYSFGNVKRNQQVKFSAGRTKNLKDYPILDIEVSAWDEENREYHAYLRFNKVYSLWMRIDLNGRHLLEQ